MASLLQRRVGHSNRDSFLLRNRALGCLKGMKAKFFKAGGIAVLAVCVYILGTRAQPITGGSNSVTTNWIGCLVVGKDDTMDRLARGPHPATDGSVEIGLRSDGVVVWRPAVGMK
jgi:hypothetical protein